jgi:hypothetical protein
MMVLFGCLFSSSLSLKSRSSKSPVVTASLRDLSVR